MEISIWKASIRIGLAWSLSKLSSGLKAYVVSVRSILMNRIYYISRKKIFYSSLILLIYLISLTALI